MSVLNITVAYMIECLVGEPSVSVSLDLFIWTVILLEKLSSVSCCFQSPVFWKNSGGRGLGNVSTRFTYV